MKTLILALALLTLGPITQVRAEVRVEGVASWYSVESCQREGTSGVWTASGERFYNTGHTCAMRSRDFGKHYKVTNLDTGRSVIVKHNDFGPNKRLSQAGRVIDLSPAAFAKIGDLKKGLIKVSVKQLKSS